MTDTKRAALYIGPSGWSYPDWEGIVYPSPQPAGFDALAYMSRYFTALEVNTSFYRPPAARMTGSWVRRVHHVDRFRFVFKLHQRFTHQRREQYSSNDVKLYKEGLAPVVQAGLLGCVLMQFPWSFRCTASAMDWLERLREDFAELPLALEVRHASWDCHDVRERIREMGINYCNIDQPQLRDCLAPSSHVTGPVGYVRLHGRRRETWFADNTEPHERYNYLYREEELKELAGLARKVAAEADSVYVFTNNHYRGQAPANALQLRAMLEQGKVAVPAPMLRQFAFLEPIAEQAWTPSGRQESLFDL